MGEGSDRGGFGLLDFVQFGNFMSVLLRESDRPSLRSLIQILSSDD